MSLEPYFDTESNIEANCIQNDLETLYLADNQQNDSILSCLSNICLNEDLADVYFSFPGEESRRYPAHKMVLSLRSPVFKAMFYGTFPQQNGDVEILDIKASTFNLLLRYIYTDRVQLTGQIVISLLYAAQKYQIQSLLSLCESFLRNNLWIRSACTIYSNARLFSLDQLKQDTLKFIALNAADVFEVKDFLAVPANDLVDILKLETINITEVKLFQSILKWVDVKLVKAQKLITGQNRRGILLSSGILYLIAFPSLSIDDFTKIVVPTGILTDEEQLQLFKAITMNEISMWTKFRVKPRNIGKVIKISIDDIIPSLEMMHLQQNTSYNSRCPMNEKDSLHRTQNIYLRASKTIRVVSANIKPKFVSVRPGYACTVACTFRGKTVDQKYTYGEDCIIHIDEEFTSNDTRNIVFEIKDERQEKISPNDWFRTSSRYQPSPNVQFQMLPNKYNIGRNQRKLNWNKYFTPGKNRIDFSFEGIYLVDTFDVIELD
ncbi:BTB/POZ domain-containing protein 3-like isoform X1 [Mytilus edulis]|uniref:BTB/POZ domain-containing protein 3-like isoform X1 n=1 Tax=Mytilus edulis TaxID=6550 RepID=UPI0039F12E05